MILSHFSRLRDPVHDVRGVLRAEPQFAQDGARLLRPPRNHLRRRGQRRNARLLLQVRMVMRYSECWMRSDRKIRCFMVSLSHARVNNRWNKQFQSYIQTCLCRNVQVVGRFEHPDSYSTQCGHWIYRISVYLMLQHFETFIRYILTHRGKLSLELADNLGEKFSKQYGIDNDTTVAVDTMQIT